MNRKCAIREMALRTMQVVAFVIAIVPLLWWTGDYLSATRTFLSFKDVACRKAVPEGAYKSIKVVGGVGRLAILAHPPSRLEWLVKTRKGVHEFQAEVALEEGAWGHVNSDGVTFRGLILQGGIEREFLRIHINPHNNPDHQRWVPVSAPLEINDRQFILALETDIGPNENADFDWALWAEPKIFEGTAPLRVWWVVIGVVGFVVCGWMRRRRSSPPDPLSKDGEGEGTPTPALPVNDSGTPTPALPVNGEGEEVPPFTGGLRGGYQSLSMLEKISLLAFAGILVLTGMEQFFRGFPLQFPYAAHRYLPENGLFQFSRVNPRWFFLQDFGYKRWPKGDWSWRREQDLLEMGLVSEAYSESNPPVIRFQTDEHGFRNPTGMTNAPIIAVGDSFTEAPDLPQEETWPSILSQELGQGVLNLGVTEYAPQQSLMALKTESSRQSVKWVLFPLVESTAVLNADRFMLFQESAMLWLEFVARSKRLEEHSLVFRRLSYSYTGAFLKYLGGELGARVFHALTSVEPPETFLFNPIRGEIAGTPVQMAFSDEELYSSTFPKSRWLICKGWEETCEALREAKKTCDEQGSRLLVLLFPAKGSVYLPSLLKDFYDPVEFDRFVRRIAKDPPPDGLPWHEAFLRNHEAVRELVTEFCGTEGIELFDLRPALIEAASKGNPVYFSADTHWNAYGHCVVGEAVAEHIRGREQE
ncbi:MAG TPA: hypothetical protein PLG59_00035 [bacterium]|nr:hypothetical protein [bacterium]HQO33017.1 hypothetical protein [bacterium]HQP97837.1 hypothetical protein [bacterium]